MKIAKIKYSHEGEPCKQRQKQRQDPSKRDWT
jgi:hypothetical protein